MSDIQLFTAEVFQISTKSKLRSNDNEIDDDNNNQPGPFTGYKLIGRHPNMTSARVIKNLFNLHVQGKIIELEHSSLVAQPVKFKTIMNYDRYLEPDTSLGVVLQPQEGYIAKLDNEEPTETVQSQASN